MGALDFLFEGRPPKSVTTYGQSVQNVPVWLSDYTQGMIARANAIAAEPYQPYGGPRIAGFSPTQNAAFDMTVANVGKFDPYIKQALSTTSNLPGQGALNQAMNYIPEAFENTATEAAQPFVNQASQRLPEGVGNYMNPYVENVINRAGELAGRQFREQIMPQISDTFTGAGQFGSSRMREITGRAERDMAEGLQGQAQAALADAYSKAGEQFQADQGRMGALAQLSGNLASADAATKLQGSQLLGQLGSYAGDLGLRQGQQLGALGQLGQSMGLKDAAALEAVGMQEQQLGQRNLDLAYQDFLEQRDYPKSQVDWMSQIIRGLPPSAVPTSTTTSSTGPASVYQPSPLAQLASLGAGWQGLQQMGAGGG